MSRRFLSRFRQKAFGWSAPDLQDELAAHLEEKTEELMAGGLSAEDARLQALREFGNVTLTAERARDVWRTRWLDEFGQDLRYALRILRKSPGFALTAGLCLALCIGAVTAIFSIVYGVLLRPLPYRDPQQLAAVWDTNIHQRGSKLFASYRDFENWRDHSTSFVTLAGATWAVEGRMLTGRGAPQQVFALPATVEFFRLLGISAALGRTFEEEDLSRGCTLVLSHRFWQGSLGGDSSVIGRQLRLGDDSCTVIGVMPAGFAFYPAAAEMWSLITPDSQWARHPDDSGIGVFGRLKPGGSVTAAHAELAALAHQLNGGIRHGAEMEPAVYPLQDEFTWLAGRNLRLSLWLLFGAVTAVLLIGCVNVANLLLGRALVRQREFTIRAALGSGRSRLLRQQLTESLLLALGAAGLGVLFAALTIRFFRVASPIELPPGTDVTLNFPVLLFAAGLTVLTTVLFGFVPAWKAADLTLHDALKAGTRALAGPGGNRLAQSLAAIEVTLSLVLLAVASLLMQSAMHFGSSPLGFQAEHLSHIPVTLLPGQYAEPEQRAAFYARLLDETRSSPEVTSATLSTAVPLRGGGGTDALAVAGHPVPTPQTAVHDVSTQAVAPGYFAALLIPLRQGRGIEPRDTPAAAPVAVINETLARRYFSPAENPIGRSIRLLGSTSGWLTIVGITADEKRTTVYQEMGWVNPPIVYRALAQQPPASVQLLVRSVVSQRVQERLRASNSSAFFGAPESIDRLMADFLRYPRFRSVLSGVFAAAALLLAAVGLYGVLSQLVAQRTREIGLRLALGAERRSVLSMIVRQGMLLVSVGIAAGLAATLAVSRFLTGLLYGLSPLDPVTLVLVSGLLLTVSLLAAYLPAARAAAVDPIIALREE